MSEFINRISQELQQLSTTSNLRSLPAMEHQGKYSIVNGVRMLNLSSNDYMGLAANDAARTAFLASLASDEHCEEGTLSSSSSRLLTGNYTIYSELEAFIAQEYGTEAALVFNSGYHANTGILPAVAQHSCLILADKLVHASIIDGIRLSGAPFIRYRHNDMTHLENLLAKHCSDYSQIIIVTESIFSMDGDKADLLHLVELKKQYPQVMLYVDEAHAYGTRGDKGLGLAEELGCITSIDWLVGTFGKAGASVGAYVVCTELMRTWLVNKMRTLIFTTGLPPINVAWTLHMARTLNLQCSQRQHLQAISDHLREGLKAKGFESPGDSNIVPILVGPSDKAIDWALYLQRKGFYVLPVRPPTVPEGSSRLRLSLRADITMQEIDDLLNALPNACDMP